MACSRNKNLPTRIPIICDEAAINFTRKTIAKFKNSRARSRPSQKEPNSSRLNRNPPRWPRKPDPQIREIAPDFLGILGTRGELMRVLGIRIHNMQRDEVIQGQEINLQFFVERRNCGCFSDRYVGRNVPKLHQRVGGDAAYPRQSASRPG